jgi:phenylalanyl-tRNA synthetase beta chain
MKVSYNWLQNHIEQKLPSPEEVKEKIIFHAFEVEDVEEKNGDTIFDIKVLPDRAHDCLSHAGIAKELAGLLGLTLKKFDLPKLPTTPLSTKVEIQTDLVRRYMVIEMSGVKIGPSPEWLKSALESVGARSINNVVDATNLVLLDDGQPVHAFDKDKIDGGIVVRMAHEEEKIITLSDEEKALKTSDMVIADYLGPLAISGVKGGKSAEINDETKNIIIEIGNFDPVSVRKTSRRLSLITDASKRFENEITPEMIDFASLHIVSVIKQIAGGEVVGVYDYYPKPVETRTLTFKLEDITKVLGSTIKEEDIDLWVSRYNVVSKKEGSSWNIEIPKERLDITGTHDIAEEIGRMVGYDKIPVSPVPFSLETKKDSAYHKVRAVKYWLAQNGFREVMNYTFTKKGEAYVAYGAKDKSALRSNLSDGLKESYEKNRLNAPLIGVESVRIFEVGTVFSKDGEQINVATCDKGTFEELTLEQFIEKYKIDITNTFNFQLSTFNSFTMWPLYPFVTRDIAVWCDSVEEQNKLEEIVSEFAKNYCVREPVLFDRFEKDGKTSVAYRLVFQSYEKTLTEEEVEGWFAKLVKEIKSEKGFEIR